jgi:hypothetical protein
MQYNEAMLQRLQKQVWVLPLFVSLALILFIYRGILVQPSNYLPDSFDFPYYAWVLDHVLQFIGGTHQSLFTTNAFFPFENSYFFSDLLIPQALFGLLPHLLGANPIFITNWIIITTLFANSVAAIYLWKRLTKSTLVLTFATISTALSPFILLQRGHLQMMTIWPFLIIIGLLLRQHKKPFIAVAIGLLWTLQLLASAYLAIFLIICVGWMVVVELLTKSEKKALLIFYTILMVVAGATGGPILVKYKAVQESYGATINYGEYITYNAHLSDYLFIPYQTLGSKVTEKWQTFNQHTGGEKASFPGLALVSLAALGMFNYQKQKKSFQITIPLHSEHLFFLGLLVLGVLFSLGPRLFINGAYAQLPLPYAIPLKGIPFFTAIRATARWSWLAFLALSYFSLVGFSKIKQKKRLFFSALFAICMYCVEIIPVQTSAVAMNQGLEVLPALQENCNQQKSVLIYPITQQHEQADMFTNLSNKTEHLLRTTQHDCQVVNGYGGFEPPQYKEFEISLDQAIENNDFDLFISLAQQKNLSMILLESSYIAAEQKQSLDNYLETSQLSILSADKDRWYLIDISK